MKTPVETNLAATAKAIDAANQLDQAEWNKANPGSASALRVVVLPTGSAERKNIPMCRGLLDYFPAGLAAVAELSQGASTQHKHTEMHWERGKSADHADCIVRHLVDRGTFDTDGKRHSTKVAWRALALLEEELEAAGAPRSRASR